MTVGSVENNEPSLFRPSAAQTPITANNPIIARPTRRLRRIATTPSTNA